MFVGVASRDCELVPVEEYVLDVLMRDLVGHDRQPAAYLVYLHLYSQAVRADWNPVSGSLSQLAEATGLSKSAVQTAMKTLHRRELIVSASVHATAIPKHRVLRHWRRANVSEERQSPQKRLKN